MGRQRGALRPRSLPSDYTDETWQGVVVVRVSDKWLPSCSTTHWDGRNELFEIKYIHICISRRFVLATLLNFNAPLRE